MTSIFWPDFPWGSDTRMCSAMAERSQGCVSRSVVTAALSCWKTHFEDLKWASLIIHLLEWFPGGDTVWLMSRGVVWFACVCLDAWRLGSEGKVRLSQHAQAKALCHDSHCLHGRTEQGCYKKNLAHFICLLFKVLRQIYYKSKNKNPLQFSVENNEDNFASAKMSFPEPPSLIFINCSATWLVWWKLLMKKQRSWWRS